MRKVVLLVFLLLTYLLLRPILGDVWYPMHDTTSVARAYLLGKTLGSGQIPAVWATELSGGAGYPLFHFYAPAFSYLSLLGKIITGSYFVGIKLTLMLTAMTGLIGMYMLTRKWGRLVGLVTAVSYGLLPYAAVDLFVRGAFAEYLAMGLLPWVFYIWTDLSTPRRQVFASLITVLFILSHNLIPLITIPFLAIWILVHSKHNPQKLVLPTVLVLALSAFYVAPLLFERNFVVADRVARTTDYTKHFVAPSQLWNSAWGYGGSGLGVEDGMSFKVGKIALLLAGLSSLLILIKRQQSMLFFVVSAAISLYMTTSYSALFWHKLPYLATVQFPWRFLTLAGFFVSILAGYILSYIPNKLIQATLALIVVAGLIWTNLKLFKPQTVFPADLSLYTSQSYLSTIPQIVPEYLPKWVGQPSAVDPSSTVLPYYFYPTWKVTLDGKSTSTYPADQGYLAFANPHQSTDVIVTQAHTQLEILANIISLLALVITLSIYVKN